LNVPVGDELLRCKNRGGEAEAIHDVLQTALELFKKVLWSISFHQDRSFVCIYELFLAQHAVDSLELLLLCQLQAVVRLLLSLSTMDPGRVLLVQHGIARFAKDVCSILAGDAIFRTSIPSHYFSKNVRIERTRV